MHTYPCTLTGRCSALITPAAIATPSSNTHHTRRTRLQTLKAALGELGEAGDIKDALAEKEAALAEATRMAEEVRCATVEPDPTRLRPFIVYAAPPHPSGSHWGVTRSSCTDAKEGELPACPTWFSPAASGSLRRLTAPYARLAATWRQLSASRSPLRTGGGGDEGGSYQGSGSFEGEGRGRGGGGGGGTRHG